MQTLAQLRSGALKGTVSLKLNEGLTHFPREIFELAETLEVLDLNDNELTELPEDFGKLNKLRILFCSNNPFAVLPEVLGDCPVLDMVGFKANKIERIPPRSLNTNLRWLILTDNRIASLPEEIGQCKRMQKLMLAGNRLSELPPELGNCSELALLRISANRLQQLPGWLLAMPKLSWLAFSGNPFGATTDKPSMPAIDWQDLNIEHVLGEGASGVIYKGVWRSKTDKRDVAIKVYKGDVTSDGLPADEINTFNAAGEHPGLVKLVGQLAGHPEGKKGVVMELIAPRFRNLGMPPDFESCTRDVYPEGMSLTMEQVLKVSSATANVAHHLHSRGLMHGDLYAHNTLTDAEGNTLLSDFGAASLYSRTDTKLSYSLERLEVMAFGYMLDDLLSLCHDANKSPALKKLELLRNAATAADVLSRPDFGYMVEELGKLA